MPKSSKHIPLSVPTLGALESQYVAECLASGFVSSAGSYIEKFELGLANYLGVRNAVSVSSGTAALHLALLGAEVAPDDEVLVSNLSFVASANAIRYVGGVPVLIGCESTYWQMNPDFVGQFLEKECVRQGGELRNRRTGRRVRAIMPVHILGHPVEVRPLAELAQRYGLILLENCAESIGAEYGGKKAGAFGTASAFSFNGSRIMTCGMGGLVATDRDDIAERVRHLRNQAKSNPTEYEHDMIGFNYQMTNVQAAIGCAQLEQLESLILKRRAVAARYLGMLEGIPGIAFMREAPWARSIYWLCTLLIDDQAFGIRNRLLMQRLALAGIQTRTLWQPMHLSPAHRGTQSYRCETDDLLWGQALSLPSSAHLSPEDQERVVRTINDNQR